MDPQIRQEKSQNHSYSNYKNINAYYIFNSL